MPEIKCYFDLNETILNAVDLSPATASKSTTKSTRSNIYRSSHNGDHEDRKKDKYIGDISMHFNGISISNDSDRSRSGHININLRDPNFNICLQYSSFGIFPNIKQPESFSAADFNGVPTHVTFKTEDNIVYITIFQA